MKMKLLAGAAVATVLAATGASAQVLGWYGAIDIGGHKTPAMTDTFDPPVGQGFLNSPGLVVRTNQIDYTGFARLGYRFSPHLRVEIEGGYRHAGLRSVNDPPGTPVDLQLCNQNSAAGSCNSPEGTVNAWTGMANVLFDVLPTSRIDPFIGGGLGVMHVKVRADGTLESSTVGFTGTVHGNVDDGSTKFAYQGIAGLSYQASERLNIDLTYRYLSGSRIKFLAVDQTDQVGAMLSGRYQDHSVTLGIRYAFAAPPPPAPPPPPPPVVYEPRDYVIYFPWDQYVITPEAQSVLQDAAKYSADGHATKETVVGYTDTSGSVAYNMRLSERRAKATADGLVALGVPQGNLDVSWKGKSDPAVATGDGVREPLNRRATIHVAF